MAWRDGKLQGFVHTQENSLILKIYSVILAFKIVPSFYLKKLNVSANSLFV